MEYKEKETGQSSKSINPQNRRRKISFDLDDWFVEEGFIHTEKVDLPGRKSDNKEIVKNKSSSKKQHNILLSTFMFVLAAFIIAFCLWDYGYINIPCFMNLNNNYYEGDDELDLTNDELDLAIGNTIEFGSFPQTQVCDEDLINELNECDIEWNYFDVYSGNNELGSMQTGDFMLYSDVVYNGEKYRAVKFSQYRPRCTHYDTDVKNSEQYKNGYVVDNVYWFKYEPLKWRVISEDGLAISETIVSAEAYQNTVYSMDLDENGQYDTYEHFQDESYELAANDYYFSSLYYWLNNIFLNTAFDDQEIQRLFYDDLEDVVDLTSIDDVCDEELDTELLYERVVVSDYAKCMGLRTTEENLIFWICAEHDFYDCGVVMNDQGDICYGDNEVGYNHVYDTGIGVRPVIGLG